MVLLIVARVYSDTKSASSEFPSLSPVLSTRVSFSDTPETCSFWAQHAPSPPVSMSHMTSPVVLQVISICLEMQTQG